MAETAQEKYARLFGAGQAQQAETAEQKYQRLFGQQSTPETAVTGQIRQAADKAAQLRPDMLRPQLARDQLKHLGQFHPSEARKIREDVQSSARSVEDTRKRVRELASLARREGRPEIAAQLQQTAAKGEKGSWAHSGASGFWGFIEGLDIPRQALLHGVKWFKDDPDAFKRHITSQEWWKSVKDDAAKEGFSADDVLYGFAKVAGVIPGGVMAAMGAGAGAVSDAMAGAPVLASSDDILSGRRIFDADFKRRQIEQIEDNLESGAEFMGTTAADPLSWVTFGGAGGAKSASSAALRAFKRAGIDAARAERAAEAVGKAASSGLTLDRRIRNAKRVYTATLGHKKGSEAFEQAAGKAGEFLDRGQAGISLPFAERYSLSAAKAASYVPGLKNLPLDHIGKRAVQAAIEPTGAIGSVANKAARLANRLPDPVEREVMAPVRGAELRVAGRAAKEAETMSRGTRGAKLAEMNAALRQLAELAPADKARREFLVKRVIDPFFHPDAAGNMVAPMQVSLGSLAPNERAYVEGIRDFLRRNHAMLQRAGVDVGSATNPVTGDYYPRMYKALLGVTEDAFDFTKARDRGGGFGVPLGADDATPEMLGKAPWLPRATHATGTSPATGLAPSQVMGSTVDPHEVLPALARQSSAKYAQARLKKTLAQRFGRKGDAYELDPHWKRLEEGSDIFLPTKVKDILDGSFDNTLDSFAQYLKSKGHPQAAALASVFEKGRNWFKERVLVRRLGYHTLNWMNDVVQMTGGGMPARSVLEYLTKADEIVRAARKGKAVPPELALARRHNIGMASIERADMLDGATGKLSKELVHISEKARGTTTRSRAARAAEKAAEVEGFASKWGGRAIERWDDTSKLAMFLYRMDMGDAPARAARVTFDHLMDYSDRNKATQYLRWLMPFATWAAKAPKMTALSLARRPGRVMAPHRASEAFFGGDEREYEVPRYLSESRGDTYGYGPEGRRRVRQALDRASKLNALVTGEEPHEISEGYGFAQLPRFPFPEAVHPWLQLAQGDPRPVSSMMAPGVKGLIEMLMTKRDLYTQQDIGKVLESQGRTPLTPGGSQALGAFNRYVAPSLVDPNVAHALNMLNYRLMGGAEGGAPISTVGFLREKSFDPQVDFAKRTTNLAWGLPFYPTSPAGRAWNIQHDPATEEFRAAASKARSMAEAAKQARRRKREGR